MRTPNSCVRCGTEVAITPVIFFGWEIDNPVAAIAAVPVGVVLFLCCLHLFNGLAWLYGVCARVMLGPSSVELRERVEGLKDASARILAAADDERRRIERDLHNGAQQRLVALNVLLGVVESKLDSLTLTSSRTAPCDHPAPRIDRHGSAPAGSS